MPDLGNTNVLTIPPLAVNSEEIRRLLLNLEPVKLQSLTGYKPCF